MTDQPEEQNNGFVPGDPTGALPPTPDEQALLDMILAFVNADDWDESREVLGRSPMLLTPQAEQAFEGLIQMYLAQDDMRIAYHLALHRDLLRDCREYGYDEAFRSVTEPPGEAIVDSIAAFIQAQDWQAAHGVLESHPELLTREAEIAFRALVQAALEIDDQARFDILISHHELLRACREIGVEAAFERAQNSPEDDLTDMLMTLSVIGHNTIAVMLAEQDKKEDWLQQVKRLQKSAEQDSDPQLVQLLSAIMRLLNGVDITKIEPTLTGGYAAIWGQIVASVQNPPVEE